VFVSPFYSNIFSLSLLSALLSNTLNLCASITATVQISHQNKTSKHHLENRRHKLNQRQNKRRVNCGFLQVVRVHSCCLCCAYTTCVTVTHCYDHIMQPHL